MEQQYLQLLRDIKEKGTLKSSGREGMPRTKSLFGYQIRHSLAEGFPLLTTKKVSFKNIVVELLWFLKGDINIKFLDEYNCRKMWHEDAYNYYCKIASKNTDDSWNAIYMPCSSKTTLRGINIPESSIDSYSMFTFEEFCEIIKNTTLDNLKELYSANNYTLGDCGYQYGKVWRDWRGSVDSIKEDGEKYTVDYKMVDQIKNVLTSLKNNPEGRRHIVTAIDPAHDTELALYWCHAMFQFNCRPIELRKRKDICEGTSKIDWSNIEDPIQYLDERNVPKYFLDCQLYQRSADSLLGVPYNIASYSLLIHLFAKILNMVPGDYIHTFGDVHIYENHFAAVDEQLAREPRPLPNLNINTEFWLTEGGECGVGNLSIEGFLNSLQNKDAIECLLQEDIQLFNYNPHSKLENDTTLSTGLKK